MCSAHEKPERLPVRANCIPDALKMATRWLCWSWVWNEHGQKWDKPPLNAATGRNASSTDPATWTDFSTAMRAHERGDFDGIGFALGEDRATRICFAGFDLDNCIEEDEIDAGAVFLASCLDSYTEISPSKNGLKVFTLGRFPAKHRCSEKDSNFELYDGGRYFTVTGCRVDWCPATVNERDVEMARLYDRLFPPRALGGATADVRARALAALEALDPLRAADYRDWLLVGMALKNVGEDLLPAWDDWSRKCEEKYKLGACEAKWRTFRKSGVGLGSLIHWAREDGWQERPIRARVPPPSSPAAESGQARTGDPHAGDGLTEEDGAGPWILVIEKADPLRYLLKSPIWADSPLLKEGFLTLDESQLFSWPKIRHAAAAQAGIYVRPDRKKTPIWDGRGDRGLLRRLFREAEQRTSDVDYDRVLRAAEFILDQSRSAPLLTEEKRATHTRRSIFRLEDGGIFFNLRGVSAAAKKDAPGVSFEALRDAATRYGVEDRPRFGGERRRFILFSAARIQQIETDIFERHSGSDRAPSVNGTPL